MSQEDLQMKLEELVAPICARRGLELVQVQSSVQRGAGVVRIMIDRERADSLPGSGVDIDDCTEVSRELSVILDEDESLVPGAFRLEVSSPGLERPLVREADYVRFAGSEATVKTRSPVEGKRSFSGTLAGMDGGFIRIHAGGTTVSIPFEVVSKAHLIPRF